MGTDKRSKIHLTILLILGILSCRPSYIIVHGAFVPPVKPTAATAPDPALVGISFPSARSLPSSSSVWNIASISDTGSTRIRSEPKGETSAPNSADKSDVNNDRNKHNNDNDNYNEKWTTNTGNGEDHDSPRLTKARRLLDEYLNVNQNDLTEQMDSTSIDYDAFNDDDITVSETFWANSNLLNNNASNNATAYVTRWTRGVKIAEPLEQYDPVRAEQTLFRQPARWVLRNVQIAVPLGSWVAGVVLDLLTDIELQNRRARAQQLLRIITNLGPAIIKGGQALASRPDLLPSEYLEELQKLQDDVPTYSTQLALKTVEDELNIQSFDELFELIEPEPVAAASIGQVYKARLKSNGDTVALKIQRPGCERVIALDLYVLRWWSGVANTICKLLNRDIDVQSIIDDFGVLIYRELDYVAEAANAQRFAELYSGIVDVFVPKVYSDLTTSKVLTMEWIDGVRLTDTRGLERYNLDRKKLVDVLVQCSMRQILENGFFHADPHAGNLLACPDGRLCFLDFGMMSYAATAQRNGFLLAVVHMVNRDWGELVKLYQKLGFIPMDTDLKPIEMALENALPDVLNADVSELNFKNVINALGDIMYTYPFSLPPFYIAIIRCLGVLEGLAIQVDPQFRVVRDAYPYIASRVLTDSQDDLQEALRRLAFTNEGHVRWDRLEGLLEEAKSSSGYDVTSAIEQLSTYVLNYENDALLYDLADQIVDSADALGADTIQYLLEASRALAINDEVALVRAFKALRNVVEASSNDLDVDGENAFSARDVVQEMVPEPTPAMKNFLKILSLIGAQGTNSDPAKYIPLIRKLGGEPRIQRLSSEIVARLSERALSRSLRAMFGLPTPIFSSIEENNDVEVK